MVCCVPLPCDKFILPYFILLHCYILEACSCEKRKGVVLDGRGGVEGWPGELIERKESKDRKGVRTFRKAESVECSMASVNHTLSTGAV